ncbi:class I SAM-dependent methyltransferase [Solirubrobacter phytolaccae]|uniref:Class I SAM-dependent methyltransferase n=1 Tax=Solirubrobacter phytolaccae TaxID=1404360 RepID=A0A9X3N804_9ACTN|nr:class I SAM-dependent methyltransferase [Solirubrobacter phytolaccae]MDA0181171.1 class I SAM-dependent methyltransferase [Solirubrobacter phytolaccae]
MLRSALLDRALTHPRLPDPALRFGSRLATRMRLKSEQAGGVEAQEDRLRSLVWHLSHGPISEREPPDDLPAAFYALFLGPREKYSCALWTTATDLPAAEEAMLALTCERAQVADGMDVLDLACGWGALAIWIAERYPAARVVGVTNSAAQREHIERRGLANLEVLTAEEALRSGRTFDRVLAVELLEHMRNWKELLHRVAAALTPDGRVFIQHFSHRSLAYRFEGAWASERLFTGTTMPSHDLLLRFQDDLVVEDRWAVAGFHYARTLRAWLERLDANSGPAVAILEHATTRKEARRRLAAWRLFLISAAEIWSRHDGDDWLVSHYFLAPRRR